MMTIDLQTFAEAAPSGNNNSQNVATYEKAFARMMKAVFSKKAYFRDFFGGTIETKDGIQSKDIAFSLKTCDIPLVVGSTYNKGANVAMGTGTANSSRFGNRTEIIYTDKDVPYTWEWVFHEGIDKHTVNNSMESAIADRLELQARGKTATFNAHQGKFISDVAGKIITTSGTSLVEADVKAVFNELSKHFVDNEIEGEPVMKCTSDFKNLIVDSGLATTGKNSSVSVDENEIVKFKGFTIEVVPSSLFQTGEVAYAYVPGIGRAFTGIETARTIESEFFDGVALQGAGKAGEFILEDNKLAVCKVKLKGA